MRLEPDEIEAIAAALAPAVADLLEARLAERPEWAFSLAEAAAWTCIPERVIRNAVDDGRLLAIRIGRQVRIRRSDLFRLRDVRADGEGGADGST